MPSAPRKPTRSKTSATNPSKRPGSRKPKTPEPLDPTKPFRWRDPNNKTSTEAEQKVAIDHLCACLARGSVELGWLCYEVMIPRIPKMTLHQWREKNPEWNQQIDEAFEVGGSNDMMKALRITDGIEPLIYGHTTAEQRKKYRADIRRDRLRANMLLKRTQALHRRYRERQILEGDTENPLIPSTFVIQPVRSRQGDEEVADRHDEEE